MAYDNPILDSRIYKVGYCDGYEASIEADVINENLFTEVDQEGNRFVLIKSILDTRTNSMQSTQQDFFVITKSGTKRRKKYK